MLHLLSESAGRLKPSDVSARMLKKESGGFQYKGLQMVPWSPGEGRKPWDCKGCVGPALILKDLKAQQIHSFIWQVFPEYLECAREAVLVMNSQSRGRLEIRDQKSSGKQHLSCAGLGRSLPDLWPHLGGWGGYHSVAPCPTSPRSYGSEAHSVLYWILYLPSYILAQRKPMSTWKKAVELTSPAYPPEACSPFPLK